MVKGQTEESKVANVVGVVKMDRAVKMDQNGPARSKCQNEDSGSGQSGQNGRRAVRTDSRVTE